MNALRDMRPEGKKVMGQCLVVTNGERTLLDAQLGRLLEGRGFSVIRARGVEEALRLCWCGMPAVIFVPKSIEGSDATTLLRRLHRMPRAAESVVLVYAEAIEPGDIGRMIWEGAVDCIAQPFDLEILDTKLRQAGVATI